MVSASAGQSGEGETGPDGGEFRECNSREAKRGERETGLMEPPMIEYHHWGVTSRGAESSNDRGNEIMQGPTGGTVVDR